MNEPVASLVQQAAALLRQGHRARALETYRRVLAVQPELAECWYNLGYLLKAEGQHEAALAAYAEALARGIRNPEEVHLNRAVIYSDHLRRDDDALRELQRALACRPGHAPALLNLGNLHEERGERDPAVACYEQILGSVAAGPATGSAHHLPEVAFEALARLAHLQPPAGPGDALLQRLRKAAAQGGGPSVTAQANLLYALGRRLDTLALYDEAFDAFDRANRLVRQTGPGHDRERAVRSIDVLVQAFPDTGTGTGSRAPAQGGQDHAEPLFICGMFRSGSTLLEQVLGMHPQVTPGGEVDLLPRWVAGPLAPFPASVATLTPDRIASLAGDYRAHLARLFPQAGGGAYITDKRPDNFLLIGLIKRLFPRARIVHTVRNALDNGLSVYTQHLDQRVLPYASDLGDIGHFHGLHLRLMAHWKSLYGGDILEFDYDAFVREPRPALQRLLGFLGLPWHEACLDFHRAGHTVKTASYWQVRRPLYRDASGRWKHYEAHLGPLRQALQAAGVAVEP